MYQSFFGLAEKPFNLTPNPSYLFLSEAHSEVYAHLLYGIENRSGFTMVSGEVGTGKTTILRTLLKNLDPEVYRIAFILNPKLTSKELLLSIAREFEIEPATETLQGLFDSLADFLLEESRHGRVPVLVIDEAQNLSGDVLEQIRLLSNLETETHKLIQIVLVGQPELERQLNDPSLRQLNQRIAVRYRLTPLTSQETRSYILHRLKVAGRPDGNVFSSAVVKRIHRLSGGVPRMINLLCDRAMLTAYSDGRGIVTFEDLRQAGIELSGGRIAHGIFPLQSFLWPAIGLCLVIAGLVAWQPRTAVNSEGQGYAAEKGVTPSGHVQSVLALAANTAGDEVRTVAHNSLLAAWGRPPLKAPLEGPTEWELRGFQVMELHVTSTQLARIDLPFLVVGPSGHPLSDRAIMGLSDQNWQVRPVMTQQSEIDRTEGVGSGQMQVLIPWLDFADIGLVGRLGSGGERVARLQRLLKAAGLFKAEVSGVYDQQTIASVEAFQKSSGLTADGVVGPQTLLSLYRVVGGYSIPSLKG